MNSTWEYDGPPNRTTSTDASASTDVEILENPLSGQQLAVQPRDFGAPLIIDVVEPPRARTPLHVHPEQEESFTVARGTLFVELDGVVHTLRPGATITIPAGVPHALRTGPGEPMMMRWVTTPAGGTRALMGALHAVATARARGGSRWRELLSQACILADHRRDIRVLRPPGWVQALLRVLAGGRPSERGVR